MRYLLCLVGVGTLSACGSGDVAGNAQNAEPDTVEAVCQASCDWQRRCEPDAGTAGGAECVDDCLASTPSSSVYRPGVLASLADCFSSLPCGTSDDTCGTQIIAEVSSNPTADPSFSACMTKHDECSASGTSTFSDDRCTMVFVLTAQAKTSFDGCMTLACTEVVSCVDSALGIAPS
jgi:hypothetical protein